MRAARVSQAAGPGEVLVSNTAKDLVAGSGLTFESLGTKHFKGFVEPAAIFRANSPA
jgi:class 3 adenylate cyclase